MTLQKYSDWIRFADLLKSVSRSFFLSVRFLPGTMRAPISIAYLLARLSDTIADSGDIPVERRKLALEQLREQIEKLGARPLDLRDFVASMQHPGEKQLLELAPEILSVLPSLNMENQSAVQRVLKTIISGQNWDLEHFTGEPTPITEDDLMTYTYQVAGCVGEFWTEVGYINLGQRFARFEDRDGLMIFGKKLGQGLQLLNIIRDLHEDLPRGRHYLPPDKPITHWLGVCREFLSEGSRYLPKVRDPRVRFATALPLYLAEATALALVTAGEGVIISKKIKIPRSTVWKLAFRAAFFT